MLTLIHFDFHEVFLLTPYHVNVPFLYALETSGFLTFSGCLEVKHWHEIGSEKSRLRFSSRDFAIPNSHCKKWHQEKKDGPALFVALQQDMDGIKKQVFS